MLFTLSSNFLTESSISSTSSISLNIIFFINIQINYKNPCFSYLSLFCYKKLTNLWAGSSLQSSTFGRRCLFVNLVIATWMLYFKVKISHRMKCLYSIDVFFISQLLVKKLGKKIWFNCYDFKLKEPMIFFTQS